MSALIIAADKLDKLQDSNINAKINIDKEINTLSTESDDLKAEADMAAITAFKIRSLFKV